MEEPGETGYRFLPLKVSKSTGAVSGEALATAGAAGQAGGHLQRTLEEICRELAEGNIAADPFWRGPEKMPAASATTPPPASLREGRGRLPPLAAQCEEPGFLEAAGGRRRTGEDGA